VVTAGRGSLGGIAFGENYDAPSFSPAGLFGCRGSVFPATIKWPCSRRLEPGSSKTAASCLGKAAASRSHSKVAARQSDDAVVVGRIRAGWTRNGAREGETIWPCWTTRRPAIGGRAQRWRLPAERPGMPGGFPLEGTGPAQRMECEHVTTWGRAVMAAVGRGARDYSDGDADALEGAAGGAAGRGAVLPGPR
jgi:hypothetical protein